MCNITLSKEQTLQVIYNYRKQNTPFKYKFNTLMRWNCLRCMTPIHIKYHTNTKIQDIYCDECVEEIKDADENMKIVQRRFVTSVNIRKVEFTKNFFGF